MTNVRLLGKSAIDFNKNRVDFWLDEWLSASKKELCSAELDGYSARYSSSIRTVFESLDVRCVAHKMR